MPHQPGHVFDPYNLSPEEEKSRRLLRQAEDALAPAAMRGQLGERGPLQEFLIEQADEIKNITGAKRARITDPDAFGSFLAGKSAEFEEFTGQPAPMRSVIERAREQDARATTKLPFGLGTLPFDLEAASLPAQVVGFGAAPYFAAEAGAELVSEGVERLPSWVPTPVVTGLEGVLGAAALKRGRITPRAAAIGGGIGGGAGLGAEIAGFGEEAEQLGAFLSGALAGDAVTGFGFRAPTLFAGAGRTADPTGVRLPSGRVGDPSATVAAIRNLPSPSGAARAIGDAIAPRATVNAFADAADVGGGFRAFDDALDVPAQPVNRIRVTTTAPLDQTLDQFNPFSSAPADIQVSNVFRNAGRDIVVVQLPDGTRQGFYKRTGGGGPSGTAGSGAAGQWVPFDGITVRGGDRWFNKARFTTDTSVNRRDSPLYRTGSQVYADIGNALDEANIPVGREVDDPTVNRLLATPESIESQRVLNEAFPSIRETLAPPIRPATPDAAGGAARQAATDPRLETAQAGDRVTVFDPRGNPVEVTVTARSEAGTLRITLDDGTEELLGGGTMQRGNANSPDYILVNIGKRVEELSDNELRSYIVRTNEKIAAHEAAGSANVATQISFVTDLNALTLEARRRGLSLADDVSGAARPATPATPPVRAAEIPASVTSTDAAQANYKLPRDLQKSGVNWGVYGDITEYFESDFDRALVIATSGQGSRKVSKRRPTFVKEIERVLGRKFTQKELNELAAPLRARITEIVRGGGTSIPASVRAADQAVPPVTRAAAAPPLPVRAGDEVAEAVVEATDDELLRTALDLRQQIQRLAEDSDEAVVEIGPFYTDVPFPKELKMGDPKPQWNNKKLDFKSDVDRALYIVASDLDPLKRTRRSAAHEKFMRYLNEYVDELDPALSRPDRVDVTPQAVEPLGPQADEILADIGVGQRPPPPPPPSDAIAVPSPSEVGLLNPEEIPMGRITRRQQLAQIVRQTMRPMPGQRADQITQRVSDWIEGGSYRSDVKSAFDEDQRITDQAASLANRYKARISAQEKVLFPSMQDGRVVGLEGIDPTVPGAPTLQDIAARFPRYQSALTPDQIAFFEELRSITTRVDVDYRRAGINLNQRADILDGGFYLPRGGPLQDAISAYDSQIGGRTTGGTPGFEKEAVYASEAAGIDELGEYVALADAMDLFIRHSGKRVADAHLSRFFKSLADETGQVLGETAKQRLLRQTPGLQARMKRLRELKSRFESLSKGRDKASQDVLKQLIEDPLFDDVVGVRNLFRKVKLGKAGLEPVSVQERAVQGVREIGAAARKAARRVRGTQRVSRGEMQGVSRDTLEEVIAGIKKELDGLAISWKAAKQKALRTPKGSASIQIRGLDSTTFPIALAEEADRVLKNRGDLRGQGSRGMRAVNALNNLFRGMASTLDNSAPGIQGLLGLADDKKAYGSALRANILSWGNEDAVAEAILKFDNMALKEGRIASEEWIQNGMRYSGEQTEFQLGQGGRLSRLPGIRQANRAFGAFGDVMRPKWADDMLADELASGRSLDEIRTSGDLRRIADIANSMTGYSDGRMFASVGDVLLFAPRFLQSRLETVAKAALSAQSLAPGRRATIDQRAARRSLIKLMAYGTMLTVALNEVQGKETDFNPFKKGFDPTSGKNPNFMRVRAFGRDWSLFGTWDSLLSLTLTTASGKPQEGVRGLSSGASQLTWDLMTGEDFIGRRVKDTPEQFGAYMLDMFTPFVAEEAGESIGQIAQSAVERRPLEAGQGAVTLVAEVFGAKSSPLSFRDKQDLEAIRLGFDGFDAAPERAQERITDTVSKTQEGRSFFGLVDAEPDFIKIPLNREEEKRTYSSSELEAQRQFMEAQGITIRQ